MQPERWPRPDAHGSRQYHMCDRLAESSDASVHRIADGDWIAMDEAGDWLIIYRCPWCDAPAFDVNGPHIITPEASDDPASP